MSSPSFVVRRVGPADHAPLRALTLAAYSEYAAQIPAHWDAYRANILATLARPEPAEQWVAEQGSALVGGVLLYPADAGARRPAWPEVRLLAVAPAARNQGVGAALMHRCIGRAQEAGASALALHTSPLMRAAIRLYTHLGFQRAPELDFEPAPGLTILGYRLALPRPGAAPSPPASL